MKKELIEKLFLKFEAAKYHEENFDCWSARDLQEVLGYSEWRNFLKVIDKAKDSCLNSGVGVLEHFVGANKMIELANGAARQLDDILLTRYACYLVAQNGDSAKSEIAFAQTYFAAQTRKQEIIEQRLLDVERVLAREKLSKSEKKLSGIIYERGIDDKGFALIRSKGDAALFGGFNTNNMKQKLSIPTSRALADFLPTLTIKAKDFATELTSHNVVEKDLKGERRITVEHVDNNKAVREILKKRGVKPEELPSSQDVRKLQRKLGSEEKEIARETKQKKSKKKK